MDKFDFQKQFADITPEGHINLYLMIFHEFDHHTKYESVVESELRTEDDLL